MYGINERFGCRETNALSAADLLVLTTAKRIVSWKEKGLYVTRLRLLSDPWYPVWDVSYCHGEIDGEAVSVELPFSQLPKRGMLRAIVQAAIKDGVNAKKMGALDNLSTLC